VRLGSGLILVIKAHRAVWPEIVNISGFSRESAFDSVHAASGDHLSFTIDYQIDFFRGFVMMGEVSSTGSEIHPEEAGDHVRVVDSIALSVSRAREQLLQNRSGMALHSFFLHVLQIDDLCLGGWLAERDALRDSESHHQDSQGLARLICQPMF
jgi:hypothetical protein